MMYVCYTRSLRKAGDIVEHLTDYGDDVKFVLVDSRSHCRETIVALHHFQPFEPIAVVQWQKKPRKNKLSPTQKYSVDK